MIATIGHSWLGLRGRKAGPMPALDRSTRMFRFALCIQAVVTTAWVSPLIFIVTFVDSFGYQWLPIAEGVVQLVVVVLWFRVLRASARLRFAALAVGLSAVAVGFLPSWAPAWVLYILWTCLILIAQSRDGRWSPAIVGIGAAALAVRYLSSPLSLAESARFVELNGAIGTIGAIGTLLQAAWLLRSAHELAGPAAALPERPKWPLVGQARPWLAGLAAVGAATLPTVIAVRQGLPGWMGVSLESVDIGSLLSTSVDLAIATGGLAVLTLVAVVVSRAGLLKVTVLVLLVTSALGLASLIPNNRTTIIVGYVDTWGNPMPNLLLFSYQGSRSTLPAYWFSVGFAVAAGILFLAYSGRTRLTAVVAIAAAAVATLVLPASDRAHGKITTAAKCLPEQSRTPAEEFVCRQRGSKAFDPAGSVPDVDLVAYGRQLCDVYTRNDPGETARVQAASGYPVRQMAGTLETICPAAQVIAAARARENQEMAEWEAAD